MDVKIMSCYLVEGVFENIPLRNGVRLEYGGHWHEQSERKETKDQFRKIPDSTWYCHEITILHQISRRIGYLE